MTGAKTSGDGGRRHAAPLTASRLRRLGLPQPSREGDKEERGRVLVVGGAREVPGAMLLAGRAALRAGAGKLQMATCEPLAISLGIAMPEARVFALPESEGGAISAEAAPEILRRAERAQALLLGPGMLDREAAPALTRAVLAEVAAPAVVLDAGSLPGLGEEHALLHRLKGRAVVTPHAGEMALLLGMDEEEVDADPLAVALRAAADLRVVVALKGATTFVASPEGECFRYTAGRVGLATSGSGDVLAGIVAGLLARGASPLCAAAWGVFLHGEAGNVLARRVGALGFLARELSDELPRILERLGRGGA